MINWLLYVGIVLLPFAVLRGMDTRTPKELLALGLALSISLVALYKGKLKPFKNYWILLFLGSIYLGILFAPDFKDFLLAYHHVQGEHLPPHARKQAFSMLMNKDISDSWMYKSFFYIFIYSLMMITVASIDLTKKVVDKIFFLMGLSGLLTALYIFLQAVGGDQFFTKMPEMYNPDVNYLTKPRIGGFMGQSTIVSPYLVLVLPIVLFLRRYIWFGLIVLAIILTQSKVAIGAMLIMLIVYFVLSNRKYSKIFAVIFLSVFIGCGVFIVKKKNLTSRDGISHYLTHEASGRFPVWLGVIKDLREPFEGTAHGFTGFGAGSFHYSYSTRRNNRWLQAHNEPIEALYNFGTLGVGLLIMAFWWMRRRIRTELEKSIVVSFFGIVVCSLGTFVFQLAPIIFYTIILLGLYQNNSLGGYYAED